MKDSGYWRANLRLVAGCLAVWFLVSFGCGILFVDLLNEIPLGGFRLGFWRIGRLDREHGVDEED